MAADFRQIPFHSLVIEQRPVLCFQYLPPGKFGGGSRIDFYVFRFQLRIIYLDNLKLLRETCKAFFRRKLGNAESEGWTAYCNPNSDFL